MLIHAKAGMGILACMPNQNLVWLFVGLKTQAGPTQALKYLGHYTPLMVPMYNHALKTFLKVDDLVATRRRKIAMYTKKVSKVQSIDYIWEIVKLKCIGT